MAATKYRTTPVATDGMPPGVGYIVGNEAAERFSFYGMRAILVVFMTKHLMSSSGGLEVMGDEEAKYWYHLFLSSVYFFPTMGAYCRTRCWENTARSFTCHSYIARVTRRWPWTRRGWGLESD